MRFALDDQITSQPDAVRSLLDRPGVPALDPERPLVFSGIGTSLHACRVAAAWVAELSAGAIRPAALDAHELALGLPLTARDQVVVVSHRGTKRFPGAVLDRARAAGATTVAVTGWGAPEPAADHTLRTCPDERSATHTVSYLTALATLAQLTAQLVGPEGTRLLAALESVPEALAQTLALPTPIAVAERLAGREPLLVSGFGLDAITADEAALKLKEGSYRWAEGLPVELALHGPPAAFRPGMGAIVIAPPGDDGGRSATLRALLADLGAEVLTCGDGGEDLPFAPVDPLVRPLVVIVPLQRLTAELARLAGTNPDAIHRDIEPWASAMGRYAL